MRSERERAATNFNTARDIPGKVADYVKEKVIAEVAQRLRALGRKLVSRDTGDDVETVAIAVQGRDTDGDGKSDQYRVHGELEDHDGSGGGDAPHDEESDSESDLLADIDSTIDAETAALVNMGR